MGVVHILELVDVDHEDAERRVVPAGALDFGRQLRQQRATIEQLRQRIGAGERLETEVVGLGDFHHVRATHRVHCALHHRFREFDVGLVQRRFFGGAAEEKYPRPIQIETERQRNDGPHRDHAAIFFPGFTQGFIRFRVPDVGNQHRLLAGQRGFDLRIFVQLYLQVFQLRVFVRRRDSAHLVALLGEDDRRVTQVERTG